MMPRSPDTSVVVAGLSTWHSDHGVALSILADRPVGIQHVITESYAVLTRLPKGRGVAPNIALRSLRSAFGTDRLTLNSTELDDLLSRLASSGVSGGATYDAVVAETARLGHHQLVSLDTRAAQTYEAVGVQYMLLGT